MKKRKYGYSLSDTQTTTHLAKAIVKKVEDRLIQLNLPLTEDVAETIVQEEWEVAKKAVEFWQNIVKETEAISRKYNITERILSLIKADSLPIKDTLQVSAFRKSS